MPDSRRKQKSELDAHAVGHPVTAAGRDDMLPELTDLSLPKIGQQFGGRDHTTVMNAERRIRKDLAERQTVYMTVNELTMRIKQQAKQS
jgi:hypothetical protein